MRKTDVVSINDSLAKVTFLADRQPSLETTGDAFTQLAEYRNGGIWAGHYAGNSEWERHPGGDEFIQVIDGEATLIYLQDDQEHRNVLTSGDICVVPQGVWHRFEVKHGVKILTITPQPSDHQLERPFE